MARQPLSKREQRRRLRERAKWWDRNAERIRIAAIAGAAIVVMIALMRALMV